MGWGGFKHTKGVRESRYCTMVNGWSVEWEWKGVQYGIKSCAKCSRGGDPHELETRCNMRADSYKLGGKKRELLTLSLSLMQNFMSTRYIDAKLDGSFRVLAETAPQPQSPVRGSI